jgi:hypothetical protein
MRAAAIGAWISRRSRWLTWQADVGGWVRSWGVVMAVSSIGFRAFVPDVF